MAFKDDSVSAFLGRHTNQNDWACVVLCRDCCLWQALQTVMYETIQASFYLKNSVSFLFVQIKGERRRVTWDLPVFSTVKTFSFFKDERVKSLNGSAEFFAEYKIWQIFWIILYTLALLQIYRVLRGSLGFSVVTGSAVKSTKAEAKYRIMAIVWLFFQKVEVKGLTLPHFSRVSINSQGTKRPPKR